MPAKTAERQIWWHWQNLTKADDSPTFPIQGRMWLHAFAWKFHFEWHFWSRSCGVGVDLSNDGDDAFLFSFRLPPVSLYFGIEPPWKSWLRQILPDEPRDCSIAIHDWAIWLHPWCKSHEWARRDPWWVRGVTFHIDDFVLGSTRHSSAEILPSEPITIRLDGHEYHGTARFTRSRWKRPRWFARVREYTTIDMQPGHGLPHSGKGENSWDCGDDALCGWAVEGISVEAAIADGIYTVDKYRKRYGQASRIGPQEVIASTDTGINEAAS